MMRVLVTGAAGFIGSTLVDRLLGSGHQVVGVDDLSAGSLANLESAHRLSATGRGRFIFVEADIRAPELSGIVAGCNPDVIYHLAGWTDRQGSSVSPQVDASVHVLGAINVCEAARSGGIRRIVCVADAEAVSVSPNVAAKASVEIYLQTYADIYAIAPITLALTPVYGPRRPAGRASGAEVGPDHLHVDEAVDALLLAGRAPLSTVGRFVIRGHRASVMEIDQTNSAASLAS